MTTITELQQLVYTETNRPDLINETLNAICEATMTAHNSDFYLKDIVQAQTLFNTADYIQTIATAAIPFYRELAFFRKAVGGPTLYQPMSGSISDPLAPDPVSGSYSYPLNEYVYLTEISSDYILDDYGYEKVDIFYQAGHIINIKSSTPIINGQFGWYSFPNTDLFNQGAMYSSWIADSYPFLIVYKAAGTIFKKIGQDAATNAYMDPESGLYAEQFAMFKNSNITATGK